MSVDVLRNVGAGVAVVVLAGGSLYACWQDAVGQSKANCEEAWRREHDSDPGTRSRTGVLGEEWCQEHLRGEGVEP
jgi:hypothetical protein